MKMLGMFVAAMMQMGLVSVAHAESVLTDAKGMTVYTYDEDQGSTSVCYNACAKAWPPVTEIGKQDSDFGTTVRKDKSVQITYDGKPLYYYVGDENPGDRTGDGMGGIWHIISEE